MAIIGALAVQLAFGNLIAGALTGLILMFALVVVPFRKGEQVMADGIAMMGQIAFVMLVASGFGKVLTETGAVDALVEMSSGFLVITRV